jgi:hypothetical protein
MDASFAQALRAALSPQHQALIDANQLVATRLTAAAGLMPLPPRELVPVVCALTGDAVEQVQAAACQTLAKLPEALLLPTATGQTPPVVLATLLAHVTRPKVLEALVANRATPDDALAAWAAGAPLDLAERLAADQQRCLRCEPLVRALCANAQLPRSSLDLLFDFLVRAGVMYAELPQTAEAVARLGGTALQAAVAEVVLPAEAAELLAEEAPNVATDDTKPAATEAQPADAAPAALQPEAADAPADAAPAERLPMLKLVNAMNMAQKVALATRGNKEARSILLRDSNRVVAVAAIKNPRITDQEVQAAARSRSVNDEVIRIIANSRDMTRSYGTRLALVQNPKAPLAVTMRMLPGLRATDLKAVAKSKGLPQVLVQQAHKLATQKG